MVVARHCKYTGHSRIAYFKMGKIVNFNSIKTFFVMISGPVGYIPNPWQRLPLREWVELGYGTVVVGKGDTRYSSNVLFLLSI